MKIIIVGAGIAGLTLALACRRVGFEVKLVDKAKQLRHIGGGILLWPHGLRYLHWLGLGDVLKPYHIPVKGCKMVGIKGDVIFHEDYSSLYSLLGGEVLPIDRHTLQQALLNQLPENLLELGKECVSAECGEQAARVMFADGSEECADLIVGADGIHSNVRKSIVAESEMEYTSNCWWGGIIEQKYVPNLKPDEVYVALGLGKMCVVWPTQDHKFMWYIPVKMPKSELVNSGDGKAQLATICADWTPEIQQIIAAPPSAQSFHLPIHCVSPQTNLSTKRITLVGDAAHAIGPILAQGASLAIEDAFILVHCLTHTKGDMAAKLKRYESLRDEKTKRMHELETVSATVMINDKLEELEAFQQQIQTLSIAAIYADLIPLVDEAACREIASKVGATAA